MHMEKHRTKKEKPGLKYQTVEKCEKKTRKEILQCSEMSWIQMIAGISRPQKIRADDSRQALDIEIIPPDNKVVQ